jgi:hypothetical protein
MKIVNVVLGIATAIILGALINLGIKAFYPEPVAPTYANYPVAPVPCQTSDVKCQQQMTQYQQQQQAQADQQQAQETAYENAMKVYNRNLFIIANILGIIAFALGFWFIFGLVLSSRAVPVGIMVAGLWSIMYGYARGWDSIDDQLKFFVGLVIAVIVIGGSMWLIERYQRRQTAQK